MYNLYLAFLASTLLRLRELRFAVKASLSVYGEADCLLHTFLSAALPDQEGRRMKLPGPLSSTGVY